MDGGLDASGVGSLRVSRVSRGVVSLAVVLSSSTQMGRKLGQLIRGKLEACAPPLTEPGGCTTKLHDSAHDMTL